MPSRSGSGREITGWTDTRGTRWKIAWLPLGGYVRFAGDMNAVGEPDPAWLALPADERARTFQAKPLWQRAIVVAAGPVVNLALAVLILAGFVHAYGVDRTPAIVDTVVASGPAAAAGVRQGDRIVAIDARPVASFSDLARFAQIHPNERVVLTIDRAGASIRQPLTIGVEHQRDRFDNDYRIGRIGIGSGEPVLVPVSVLAAPVEGVKMTVQIIGTTFETIGQMVSGRRSIDELGGPIRIAKISGEQLSLGWAAFIWLVAMLSINLGFINLLPVPMLDGGHLFFYAIEAVRRRPMERHVQEWAFRGGLAMVLALMLVVTFNDLGRSRAVAAARWVDWLTRLGQGAPAGFYGCCVSGVGRVTTNRSSTYVRAGAMLMAGTMLSSVPAVAQRAPGRQAADRQTEGPRVPVQTDAPTTPPPTVSVNGPIQSGTIKTLRVEGSQRIEPETVLSYTKLRVGIPYTAETLDQALKDLQASDLFADYSITGVETGDIVVRIRENPIINRVIFEGNKSLKTDKIQKEVKLAPRQIFTRTAVRQDVTRIIELYRRQGRFAAVVSPKMVNLDQNRVDIVFEVSEGPKSKVRQINILGNEIFSDDKLRGEMVTKQARFLPPAVVEHVVRSGSPELRSAEAEAILPDRRLRRFSRHVGGSGTDPRQARLHHHLRRRGGQALQIRGRHRRQRNP